MTGAFIKVKFRHRYTQRLEGHGKREAEIGVMHLKAKECQGLLVSPEVI
jgi:hypothetical protein